MRADEMLTAFVELQGAIHEFAVSLMPPAISPLGVINTDIFDPGVASDSNTIRIGTQGTQTKTFVPGVSTTAVMG